MNREEWHIDEREGRNGRRNVSQQHMTAKRHEISIAAVRELSPAFVCGIDEAGRGPLAGPVTAAAVILSDDFPVEVLADSKRMSPKRRDDAYEIIIEQAHDWAVAWATVEEIGTYNILGATLKAMERAYHALRSRPVLVVVDGLFAPLLPVETATIPKADGTIHAVMAASILAKVARDRMMDRLDLYAPGYGFSRHKGYPVPEHHQAIARLGPSFWHRPGFRLLPQESLSLFDSPDE